MKHAVRWPAMVCATVALLASAGSALAIPITYQVSAVASGTIGASTFTDVLVTLTLAGDTANVESTSLGGVANIGTTTVSIPGVGVGTVTDPTAAFATESPIVPDVGFPFLPYVSIAVLDNPPSVDSNIDMGIVGAAGLLGYDLRTSIGPIVGVGGLLFDGGSVHTTIGNLAFTSEFSPDTQGTFAAIAVPEPSTFWLLAGGVFVLARRVRHTDGPASSSS